jgi:hypothetical protein
MTKRFGFFLAVLLVVTALLAACASESRDSAEDYMEAVIKGENDKAKELSCTEFEDETDQILQWYATQKVDPKKIDLQYDIAKGNNEKEIIVTGSYKFGEDPDDLKEFEVTASIRASELPNFVELTEEAEEERGNDEKFMADAHILIFMKKVDGDWCVEDVDFGDIQVLAKEETQDDTTTDEQSNE